MQSEVMKFDPAALVELRDWYTEHTGLPAVAANAAIAKAVQPNAELSRGA